MRTYILGNSGFAKEVFEQFFLRKYLSNFGGFIILNNDKPFVIDNEGSREFTYPSKISFVLGAYSSTTRKTFIDHFKQHYPLSETYFPNFSAESAYISKTAEIGYGNIFCNFSCINGDSSIGNLNCFNIYSSTQYGSVTGNYNLLDAYSSIGRKTTIGNDNNIETHGTITQGISIGNNNQISAGECLFDDMTDNELFQSGIITKKKDKNAYF